MSEISDIKSITLPRPEGNHQVIKTGKNLLFVGANGSGKTRLGAWLDMISPEKENVFRISAQKSLAMPDTTTPKSIEQAENDLVFGYAENRNKVNRWGGEAGHLRFKRLPEADGLSFLR